MEQVGDRLEGRRLAGPVGAQQGDDAALRHVKRDALQDQNDVVVDHFDVVDRKQRRLAGGVVAARVNSNLVLNGHFRALISVSQSS
jgi:hypothetical protein